MATEALIEFPGALAARHPNATVRVERDNDVGVGTAPCDLAEGRIALFQ